MQKTVMLINNFVLNTTSFLNDFTNTCEKKLVTVSGKITELEILLAVMEAKLNSIPDVDGTVPNTIPAPQTISSPDSGIPPPTTTAQDNVPAVAASSGEVAPPPPEAAPVDTGMIAVKDHPDYKPFAKLLKVGVPPPAAKIKLNAAGEYL